jgi:signal transduction histidine kinase
MKFGRRDARRGGSGLGLAICRQIVDAHGGSLTCRSVPGEGALLQVLLPETPPCAGAGAS